MSAIKDAGYSLKEFENANESLVIPQNLLEAFNATLSELYDMQIEEGVLS
ncbi:MAG: hypothetical protein JXQ90_06650 [Cyclobacteriaceae bacterium]